MGTKHWTTYSALCSLWVTDLSKFRSPRRSISFFFLSWFSLVSFGCCFDSFSCWSSLFLLRLFNKRRSATDDQLTLLLHNICLVNLTDNVEGHTVICCSKKYRNDMKKATKDWKKRLQLVSLIQRVSLWMRTLIKNDCYWKTKHRK